MEKRFTLKDFFLFTAVAAVLVALLVAMYMIDRQWLMMSRMRATMQEQAEDLRALRTDLKALDQRIENGALAAARAAAPPAGSAAAPSAASSDIPPDTPGTAPVFARALAAARLPGYASGDWLVRAFGVGLSTITPLVSQDAYASDVQGYVQESLLSRNPDTLEWEGLVARSWGISEDGLTITFRLRDGVTFSDGRPLRAGDVAFTFEFIMNEAIAAPRHRAYLDKIESVEAIAPLVVVFRFREPYFNALALAGSMAVMPRHFYEPYLREPATFNESKGLLLGSGPYRLADPKTWTPDLGIVELERNPRYWGPVTPSFNRILWKVIENDSARLTTFRNRDIDSYTARPREYRGLRDDEALTEQTRSFEFMNAVAGYSYIGWNQRRGGEPTRFADRRVRQAMTWLTDRARIIDEIMLGYAEPAVSPFSPRSRQHDPAVEPRGFDPDKAASLLAEAGYEDRDGDGVLEDGAGEPFEFELVYYQENEDTERMVLFLKDLYARAGVHPEARAGRMAGHARSPGQARLRRDHAGLDERGGDRCLPDVPRLPDRGRRGQLRALQAHRVRPPGRRGARHRTRGGAHAAVAGGGAHLPRGAALHLPDAAQDARLRRPAHREPGGHEAGPQSRLRPGGDLHAGCVAALRRLRRAPDSRRPGFQDST